MTRKTFVIQHAARLAALLLSCALPCGALGQDSPTTTTLRISSLFRVAETPVPTPPPTPEPTPPPPTPTPRPTTPPSLWPTFRPGGPPIVYPSSHLFLPRPVVPTATATPSATLEPLATANIERPGPRLNDPARTDLFQSADLLETVGRNLTGPQNLAAVEIANEFVDLTAEVTLTPQTSQAEPLVLLLPPAQGETLQVAPGTWRASVHFAWPDRPGSESLTRDGKDQALRGGTQYRLSLSQDLERSLKRDLPGRAKLPASSATP